MSDSMDDEINIFGTDNYQEEFYFNSSSADDGDGSIDNPYNELTLNRIKSNSIIHITNGEYLLDNGKTLNDVTIIGQDAEKSIIKYVGSDESGVFKVDVDNSLILQNVTFIGFNFELKGSSLQATNTIFRDSVAPFEYSEGELTINTYNSFGGAIDAYAYYPNSYQMHLPDVILDNCTFINNTAEYGGAISMDEGTLLILNSLFENNYAYNYGGALVALNDVNVRIKNTKFVNQKSVEDAGGSIYLLDSELNCENLTVTDSSATFGGAIASLNSRLTLINFTSENNFAKYDGGAIYQMFSRITVSESSFINNSANNGGAIFVNDVYSVDITNNIFEDNKAKFTAGSVYLLLPYESLISDNEFKGNTTDDLYQCDEISLNIGNGNYTLIFSNYTFDGEIPSKYSLLDYNLTTPVKDQNAGGNCWAFSAIAALESAILKASGLTVDLSEGNMKNIMEMYSNYGWYRDTNEGGIDEMALGYLVSWLGPVLEAEDEYDDYNMLSPVLNSFTHVQNIVYLKRNDFLDNDAIKLAILNYGGVSTGLYYDDDYFDESQNSYYYKGSYSSSNHGAVIVGWDDDYSRDNFKYKPAGNGAWIAKNSWGEDWGDNGYFYISYYDKVFAKVGESEYSYVIVFNDSEKYEKNYQYDIIGKTDYFVTGEKTIWVENIFESSDDELLAAVSTYFRKNTDYELFIYVNDQFIFAKNGSCIPGYTTINLGKYIQLSKGDKFRVVFKLTAESEVEFAISEEIEAVEYTYYPGVSFFSYDGVDWVDLYDYSAYSRFDGGHTYTSQVAAIKAFTISYIKCPPVIKINTSTINNDAYIEAVISDLNYSISYSGEVLFNISGNEFSVNVTNGIAKLNYTFDNVGSYEIYAYYKDVYANATISISKLTVTIGSDVLVNKDNVLINLENSLGLNLTVNLLIDDKNYTVILVEGKANLTLNNVDLGYHEVIAMVNDGIYAGNSKFGFNITVSKTFIMADNVTAYGSFVDNYEFLLKDSLGNPIRSSQVLVMVGDRSYVLNTDENGVASLYVEIYELGITNASILFYGDDDHFPSNTTFNFNIQSTILFVNSNYLVNSQYHAILLDKTGKPLANSYETMFIDGANNFVLTDGEGKISHTIDLSVGKHEIIIYNRDTGELLSQTINVVSRIMENKNMNVYYLSGSTYKVRVFGDDGNPVGAGEIVNVVVNKNTYSIKTDSKGYSSFKIDLSPKTYTLKATYKNFTVSNKIVVKPLLTAKDITKKKAKTVKFSAKLVNNKGKVVKGKKISFKINGKTYTAKTNKNGIATISIKNLKVGKHVITTKYSKMTIKNTIRIKK